MNHDAAGELPDPKKARDFFAVAVLPVNVGGVEPVQIMIEKHNIEFSSGKNLDRFGRRFRAAHPRYLFPEPAETILGVIENEDAAALWN